MKTAIVGMFAVALLFMIPMGHEADAFHIDHVQAYKIEAITGVF